MTTCKSLLEGRQAVLCGAQGAAEVVPVGGEAWSGPRVKRYTAIRPSAGPFLRHARGPCGYRARTASAPDSRQESDMRQRHVLVLTVLVGIFLVLAIMLVLTLIRGDDTDHRGATLPALSVTR